MTVAEAVLTDTRRATLVALCDTFVPGVERSDHDEVRRAFLARSASDLGVPAHIEGLMAQVMTPEEIEQFGGLFDALAAEGFTDADLETRTALVHGFSAQDPGAKLGLRGVKGLTLLFFYGLPDAQGQNPNWEALGFSGPPSAPPTADAAPKRLTVREVSGEAATLQCDVCVVGSGAGGGVIAARCAAGRAGGARPGSGRLPQRVGLLQP